MVEGKRARVLSVIVQPRMVSSLSRVRTFPWRTTAIHSPFHRNYTALSITTARYVRLCTLLIDFDLLSDDPIPRYFIEQQNPLVNLKRSIS